MVTGVEAADGGRSRLMGATTGVGSAAPLVPSLPEWLLFFRLWLLFIVSTLSFASFFYFEQPFAEKTVCVCWSGDVFTRLSGKPNAWWSTATNRCD